MDYALQHLDLVVLVLLGCHRQLLWARRLLLVQSQRTHVSSANLETDGIDVVVCPLVGKLDLLGRLGLFPQLPRNYVQMVLLLIIRLMLTAT